MSSSPLFRASDPLEGVRFLDVRTGPDARERFQSERLAGARWFDLETELSAKGDPAQGGRHPLPSTRAFVSLLEAKGITADDDLVCYDDKSGANAAARLWWMLTAIGHRRVRVLDGGLPAALSRGVATERGPGVAATPARYALDPRFEGALEGRSPACPTVDLATVKASLADGSRVVIDVRDADRYRGEREPIDPIAGRIAGATSVPLTENLGADGGFLAADALRARYEAVLGEGGARRAIVHCGSGVTACHTLLALAVAGLDGAALYVGSYSEWCRREPVATG